MRTNLVFRNVEAQVEDPVEAWPFEAIETAITRGGLPEWRRIVAVLRRDPWGPVSRAVEQILHNERPYGVTELMSASIARAREAAENNEREEVAGEMRKLVSASGLSQAEFASRMGTSRTRLSTYLSGRVTPSAALLVRARRVSELSRPGR